MAGRRFSGAQVCMCPAWTPVARGPGTGTTDGCESSRGCWDSNLSPLQEQQALLTTQPSPQPLKRTLTPKCGAIHSFRPWTTPPAELSTVCARVQQSSLKRKKHLLS